MISKTKIHILINFFSPNNQFNIFIHHIQCSFVSLWKLSNFQTLKNSAIFNPLCQCYFKTLTLWIFGCGSSSAPPCRWFLRWGCWPLNSGGWPQGTGGSCWWVRFDWWGRGRCWLESLSLCSPPLTPWSWKLQKPWTWLTR